MNNIVVLNKVIAVTPQCMCATGGRENCLWTVVKLLFLNGKHREIWIEANISNTIVLILILHYSIDQQVAVMQLEM